MREADSLVMGEEMTLEGTVVVLACLGEVGHVVVGVQSARLAHHLKKAAVVVTTVQEVSTGLVAMADTNQAVVELFQEVNTGLVVTVQTNLVDCVSSQV